MSVSVKLYSDISEAAVLSSECILDDRSFLTGKILRSGRCCHGLSVFSAVATYSLWQVPQSAKLFRIVLVSIKNNPAVFVSKVCAAV